MQEKRFDGSRFLDEPSDKVERRVQGLGFKVHG